MPNPFLVAAAESLFDVLQQAVDSGSLTGRLRERAEKALEEAQPPPHIINFVCQFTDASRVRDLEALGVEWNPDLLAFVQAGKDRPLCKPRFSHSANTVMLDWPGTLRDIKFKLGVHTAWEGVSR